MNKEKAVKHSIERQYAVTFSILIASIIVVCWSANVFLLERVYITRKEQNMGKIYNALNESAVKYGLDSDKFSSTFDNLATRYNCDILILDTDMNVIASNILDSMEVTGRLLNFFFDRANPDKSIIYKNDSYTIMLSNEERFLPQYQYIELWGIMTGGNPIGIRSAVSGIKDSALIANELLAVIGILAIIYGYFIVLFVSKNITRPIHKMVDVADRMASLDFNAKYDGGDDNEIGLLGSHMNKLSSTLESTISELKSANNELKRELEKRTELDTMRSDFISNASHELKTPIAVIQGYAEGLKDCVNDDDESRDFYCDVIMDEAEKMNTLVKNLLDLNELEYGSEVCIERINLTELIKNCIERADILLKDNSINLIFDDTIPVYVWSDALKLEQVINNYLSNAIHYVCGDENIIKINILPEGEKVRVNVYNSGNPIDEEALPHLWTKFYKVDKARTREYGGSGVGLSIVKAIMESLNQGYGVENRDNGVVFWFEADAKNV